MRELTYEKVNNSNIFKAKDEKLFTDTNKWENMLIESISLAVLSLVAGLGMCGLSHIFTIKNAATLNGIGTLLIIISLPLFFLMAHCLDKIDEMKKYKSL